MTTASNDIESPGFHAVITSLMSALGTDTGQHFLENLLLAVSAEFDCDYAGIAVLDDQHRLHRLAGSADGRIVDGFDQPPASPAAVVIDSAAPCSFRSRLREKFPQDRQLRLHYSQADSYIGVPLFASGGGVLGLIYLMNRGAIANDLFVIEVLQLFTDRMVTEIERLSEDTALIQTREQLENCLQHHSTELELARRELESFNYAVSHDLRGPLRAIGGFSECLAEDCGDQLDGAARGYLQRIRNNVRHMDLLLQALLSLSRVTRHELQPARVDLSHLCRKRLKRLKDREPQRRASFHIQPDVHACGDPELLTLALEQLLANAWKYTGHDHATCIEFSSKQQDGQTIYCVKDNGIGFDMAYSDKLFEVFQRLHGQQAFEGIGAGLAIVKRIIERHAGTIWAESTVGNGACFYFTLPEQPCAASAGN